MRKYVRINNKKIAASLKKQAGIKGLTQLAISKAVGIDQSQVCRFLNAKFRRRSKNLDAICLYFGVHLTHHNDQVSLAKYPRLSLCLSEILDGTKKREMAVVKLLRFAQKLT